MNIQEIREKFKSLLADDTVYYGVLVLLVGLTSFGFGRISSLPNAATAPAAIVLSETVATPTSMSTETGEPAAIEPTTSGEKKYVGSVNSDKYHLPWCSGAQRINEENKVWFVTEEEAAAAGYTAAGNCEGL